MEMRTEVPDVQTVSGHWGGPGPSIDYDNQAFWDGLKDHELLLWRCHTCSSWYWPKAYCRKHEVGAFAAGMSWQASSGLGTVFSVNRHHWAFNAAFKDQIPYTLAVVELDEGPLFSTTIVNAPDGPMVSIGSRVKVVYEDHPDDGYTLPRFALLPTSETGLAQ